MPKILLLSLSVLTFVFAFTAAPASADSELVPLSRVEARTVTGCGVVPPGGHCQAPTVTTLSFVVRAGGPCHHYTAEATYLAEGTLVSVYDTRVPHCAAPDRPDFEAYADLEGEAGRGPLKLANPLRVKTFFRP